MAAPCVLYLLIRMIADLLDLGLKTLQVLEGLGTAAGVPQNGRRVEFRYHGDGPAQALPQYRIAALPEGYTETERAEADWNVRVTYECTGKQWIRFSYLYMQDGTASSVGIAESDTVKDITVSGMSGKLILPQSSESANVIIWFDTAQNLMFSIHANVDESVIIAMAESVSLCNPTN